LPQYPRDVKCPPPERFDCRVLLHSAIVILLSFHSRAVSPDDNWDSTSGAPGADGPIRSIVVRENCIYVGGAFEHVGGVAANNIAKWDGTNWTTLDTGSAGGVFPEIQALLFIGQDLFAGGFFTQAGNVSSQGVAKWDGTNWSSLAGGVSGGVRALTTDGTNLYVGGTFTSAGSVAATNVARWNGSNWSHVGSGISGTAVDSLFWDNGDLYTGGRFRLGGGINATNIARWNGNAWSALAQGVREGSQGAVRAITRYGTNLVASGDFLMAGDVAANNVAAWDGTKWLALGSGIGPSASVKALLVTGNTLFCGGFFSVAGGTAANGIATWDGTRWRGLGSGLIYPPDAGSVGAVASAGSELLVGGAFTAAGGKPANNIALWHIPHALEVKRQGHTATLSWPATGTNFVLETKDDVAGTNWSVVSTNPSIVGDQCRITNQIDSPARFFRLRRK
jgi:hypothetical protein